MADQVIVMSDAVIQQTGTSREIYEAPRTRFVAGFIGNNNVFEGVIRSRSGSIVFVESNGQHFYVRTRDDDERDIAVGASVHFSVRADLMHTGVHADMANQVDGSYVATEFLGSLETDVFELSDGLMVHVEQHRSASDRSYDVGERATISWPAESAVLLLD